ncbi:glycoside hydrolase [Caldalkalibacillus salinus]|uniref:glycoside hydrolase n=1 Tax=Caldalkalibacillus salinus TaxID=2803787 RepID=UPI001923208D|nr:glycoside hydrolase [Caldalkalibacillus salinus]
MLHFSRHKGVLMTVCSLLMFSLLTAAWPTQAADDEVVKVYPGIQYQTHEGFGTSLAWFGHAVGGFSELNRTAIADLLFDPDEGLGLNIVRYNIGGGDHPDQDWLRPGADVPGFQPVEGEWDWTADSHQRWMMQAAKERAGEHFIAEAFSNSPPYWMTYTGTSSGNGREDNLRPEYAEAFAEYLTEVVKHYDEHWDVTFRTLNPFNEPSHYWQERGRQEGAHFDVATQEQIIALVHDALKEKGLSTDISVMDGKSIWDTIWQWRDYSATTQSYVSQINGHGYYGSVNDQQNLHRIAKSEGKRLWMSEADGGGGTDPFGRYRFAPDDMEPALNLSNMISTHLKEMQPAAWIFWQAVENYPENIRGDHTWGLIHANFEEEGSQGLAEEEWRTNKKYYAFAQYSKFIRPGYQQIGIDGSDAVAFIDWQDERLVIVQTNEGTSSVEKTFDLSDFNDVGEKVQVYRTSETEDLVQLDDMIIANEKLTTILPRESITTFVIDGMHYTHQKKQNVALNKPVTATSEQSGNEVEHMVDGQWDTRWSAQGYPQSAVIDLEQSYTIDKAELAPYQNRAYQYRIEASTDGEHYTTIVDRTSNTTGGLLLTDGFSPVDARYIKLTVTGAHRYTGDWVSIRDLRLYESQPTQPTMSELHNQFKQYKASENVTGPLVRQLENKLDQAQRHLNKGHKDQALKHLNDFLKHLSNEALRKHITEEARLNLHSQAQALIDSRLED